MPETSTAAVLVYVAEDGNAVLAREFASLSDMAIFVAEMELRRGEYVVVDGELLMRRFNDGILVLEPPIAVREMLAVVSPAFDRRKESVFDDEDEDEAFG